MTIPEILKELELYTGRFPMAAMKAAIEQREAITPELLRFLEAAAADPAEFAERKDCMLHLFAMHLLAQFREKRAYRSIINLFSAPGETSYKMAGDTVTEGLSQILGSVYDGDPGPLQGLAESPSADEYVRGAALDTFIVLVESGQMTREQVVAYYRSLFRGGFKRTYCFAWDVLVTAVADLPAPELLEEVRQAYDEGLVDPSFAPLEDLERRLLNPDREDRKRYALITDAIAEMEWWAAFHPEPSRPKRLPKLSSRPPAPPSPSSSRNEAPTPFVREPKIGRNDPCPCGSGKKYKKCCGKG